MDLNWDQFVGINDLMFFENVTKQGIQKSYVIVLLDQVSFA